MRLRPDMVDLTVLVGIVLMVVGLWLYAPPLIIFATGVAATLIGLRWARPRGGRR